MTRSLKETVLKCLREHGRKYFISLYLVHNDTYWQPIARARYSSEEGRQKESKELVALAKDFQAGNGGPATNLAGFCGGRYMLKETFTTPKGYEHTLRVRCAC